MPGRNAAQEVLKDWDELPLNEKTWVARAGQTIIFSPAIEPNIAAIRCCELPLPDDE